MFYPVSHEHVEIYRWFVPVGKLGGSGTPLEFVFSLLNLNNLHAIFWEATTLLPVIALVTWWRSRREARTEDKEETTVSEPI